MTSHPLNLRPFRSLLIANRGEIACRVTATARALGKRVIAVYSSVDVDAEHVRMADASVAIGGPLPAESYLNVEAILAAARTAGAEAIHPGYGFLAENDRFAQAVLDAGLVWIGPPPAAMRTMGSKAGGRRLARESGVPVLEGYDGDDQSDATLRMQAERVGFPLLIKASAGGGGRGMRLVDGLQSFEPAVASARAEALAAFGDDRLVLERALMHARHVEVQVFADAHGHCVHLGERDCSVQRRHQKLIEESPAPNLSAATRDAMCHHAVALARAIGYVGAGTMEFLLDANERYAFMEMNTRLQVEHPVTEARTGIDLVEWQLRVAAGESLPLRQEEIAFHGHAIEVRLCAEDPAYDFAPQSGVLARWEPPAHAAMFACASSLRLDSAMTPGSEISPYYDSMIGKLIVHADTRDAARERLAAALESFVAFGVVTNKDALARTLREAEFARGELRTDYLQRHGALLAPAVPTRDVVAAAAALLCQEHARSSKFGEWAMWSNASGHATHVGLLCAGTSHRLIVRRAGSGFAVVPRRVPGGESVAATEKPVFVQVADANGAHATIVVTDSSSLSAIGGSGSRVAYHCAGGAIALGMHGRTWHFSELVDAGRSHRDQAALDGRIVAPMTGKVVAVLVQVGEQVTAGQPLLALSAMKMEHVLTAPADLIVRSLQVASDDQVRSGQLLVQFDPP